MNKIIPLCLFLTSAPVLAESASNTLSNFFDVISQDEIQRYLDGDVTDFSHFLPAVSATNYIAAYNANEVAANEKYKGNPVRVKSIVSAIKEDFNNNPYVIVNGRNQSEIMHLNFNKNSNIPRFLSKADKIDFICLGKGMVMSIPVAEKCVDTVNIITPIYGQMKTNFLNINDKNYKPMNVVEANISLKYLGYEDEIVKICSQGVENCRVNLREMFKSEPHITEENRARINAIKALYQ